MSSELIINSSLPETRISLLENGEIQEMLIERAADKGIAGNIYKGRVTRVLPGMQAAFVDIGLEKAAFLYVDDVYVHPEIWEAEEEASGSEVSEVRDAESPEGSLEASGSPETETQAEQEAQSTAPVITEEVPFSEDSADSDAMDSEPLDGDDSSDDDDDGSESANSPAMSVERDGGDEESAPEGSISEGESATASEEAPSVAPRGPAGPRNANRRGRGRRPRGGGGGAVIAANSANSLETMPSNYQDTMMDEGMTASDRSGIQEGENTEERAEAEISQSEGEGTPGESMRPEIGSAAPGARPRVILTTNSNAKKAEFNQPRSPDRRIKAKTSARPAKGQVNIQDLLKEGQEVIVQVAKDPIATKGARLTCHISIPGRFLVCMPTIDHVGVSRRIDRDDDRRKLRDLVEKNRPKKLGFIVRTAIGKSQTERRIKQDIDYLARIWAGVREQAATVSAPALVYEDLNPVLRAIRDWVNEEIDKIIVDSKYHHQEILKFTSHFMPSLRQKVELYHGDIPIFDAYGISTELSRALERKVWLKSGGYLFIDQAEALVAIDVNTGRFVGKKNLEDTILKTNLEAVKEIAYQLRLRNCGGIIILDLIDMEKDENRQRVYRALEEELKKDRARPSILKISELGLIEMTRKRTRDTMVRALCESCTHCEGKGFIKSRSTVGYEVLREIERAGLDRDVNRILVQSHADVVDFLAIESRDILDMLEKKYRKQIYLQSVEEFHPEQFEVSTERKDRKGHAADSESREPREQREQRGSGQQQQQQNRRPQNQPKQNTHQQPRQQQQPAQQPSAPRLVITLPQRPVVIAPVDPENIGNSGSFAEKNEETQPHFSQAPALVTSRQAPQGAASEDDDMSEEDRLAYLRAQAAQDAAIAQLQAGGASGSSGRTMSSGRPSSPGQHRNNGGGGGGQHRNNGGGRNQNQRHAGGGGQNRNNNGGRYNNNNGGGNGGQQNRHNGGGRGPMHNGGQPRSNGGGSGAYAPSAAPQQPIAAQPAAPDTSSGNEGESSAQ